MKKSILSIAMLFAAAVASAQPFTNGTSTYTETFVGPSATTCLISCCVSGGYLFADGNIASGTAGNGADSIYFKAVAAPAAGVAPGYFDFMFTLGSGPTAQCKTLSSQGFGVDLSDPSTAPKLVIVAKSNVAGATVQFHIANSTNDGYPNVTSSSSGVPVAQTQVALTTSYATYTLDYSGTGWDAWTSAQKTAVNLWGALIPADNALNNGAAYSIQSITVLAGTPTATTASSAVNDQVNLFPNPAKGSFNVDMTAMNNTDAASVKVLNANGTVVKTITSNNAVESISTDGLIKGIYMVQITSGNKVATKKVSVE